MEITDLTGYTWVYKARWKYSNGTIWYINATLTTTSGEIIQGNSLSVRHDDNGRTRAFTLAYLGETQLGGTAKPWSIFDGPWVYPESALLNGPNQNGSILISGGTDATNQTLISWLEANGTLVPPPKNFLKINSQKVTSINSKKVKSISFNKNSFEIVPYINTILDLENATWAQVREVSDAGLASSLWSVGDTKSVVINGKIGNGLTLTNQTFYLTILGFDHNIATEGVGYSHSITFGGFKDSTGKNICLVDSKYNSNVTSGTYFSMNNSKSNSGGWKSSRMRYYLLGSTNAVNADAPSNTATSPVANSVMASLPSDLRAVMKPVYKYTDNTGGKSDIASHVTRTTDYLPLLAEFEIFGVSSIANNTEQNRQQRYAFYNDGMANTRERHRHDNPSTAVYWWERSVGSNATHTFCAVTNYGSTGSASYSADLCYGVSFALVV